MAPETDPGPTSNSNLPPPTIPSPHEVADASRSPPNSTVNASSSPEKPPPQSNSNDSGSQKPTTSTSDESQASGAPEEEQEEGEDGFQSDELEDESPQFRRRRVGNPGIWKPEQVAYFQKMLPAYNALGSNSKARADFIVDLLPGFLLKFPKEKYPPPEPSQVAKSFKPLSEAVINAMQSEDKKAYLKREKRALRSEDDRLLDSLKSWFTGQRTRKNMRSSNPFKPHYKKLSSKKDVPKKSSLAQFILGHEDYKDEVVERSDETGNHDRLPSRVRAAQDILAELDSETVQKLEAEAETRLQTRRESFVGVCDETSNGRILDIEQELDLASCRRNLTTFAQPLLDFIREHTGMVCFLQAGYERDHPDKGHDFEIVSLSSVPQGMPKFPEYNIPFFGQFGREFAKWVRAIKQRQLELGVESPSTELLERAETDGGKKDKGKGKAKAQPVRVSAPPSLPSSGPNATTKHSPSPSTASTSTLHKRPSSQPPKPSETSKNSPNQAPPVVTPQPLPQPPDTDGMSIPEKQAAYRVWHRELAEAMGIKEDVRNLFAGKQGKEKVAEDDDDDYEGDEEEGAEKGFEEVVQRTLRPRKAAAKDDTRIDGLEPDDAAINDDTALRVKLADKSAPMPSLINDSNPPSPEHETTAQLTAEGNDMTHPDTAGDKRSPPEHEQLATRGNESASHVPENVCKTSAPIAPSSSDDNAEDIAIPCETRIASPTSPTDPVERVIINDGGDIEMSVDAPPDAPIPNASIFDAVEVPVIDPYPPESLKNGSFIREYATLLLKSPEGESLPAFWFTLVHSWIELEGKWECLDLEPVKLPLDHRPQAFAAWFQAGRTKRPGGRVTPTSVQLPSFRTEWWLWFDSVNPDWRLRDGGVVLPGGDGDWEDIECPGKDGFALLLIGLRWWFDRGGWEDKVGLGHWEHAVKGLYETTVHLHKCCDVQKTDASGLGNRVAGSISRQDKVRKSPDSSINDGPDSHRAKRRA
ncbi:hypothetical protein V5O48_004777 [Marasmius crinis-equi]|uniref:Uncharacterized protein n=1 Tax=Marasmius crinis-equi TaxID=585013 RepID=A0ABR3FP39_9AGAR